MDEHGGMMRNMDEYGGVLQQNSSKLDGRSHQAHLNASRFIHPENPPGEEGHGLHSENLGKWCQLEANIYEYPKSVKQNLDLHVFKTEFPSAT